MFRTVEFKSTFPNDWQFDADGNPILPGARAMAEAIVARLRTSAVSVSPIDQHEYYGWRFETTFENSRFSNILNPTDVCYLTINMSWYFLKVIFLLHPRKSFEKYCNYLQDTLRQIPEISEIRWQE